MYKILRRGSGRVFVLCTIVISLLLCLYYVSQQGPNGNSLGGSNVIPVGAYQQLTGTIIPDYSEPPDAQVSLDTCPLVQIRDVDIDAQAEFEKFEFQVGFFQFIF